MSDLPPPPGAPPPPPDASVPPPPPPAMGQPHAVPPPIYANFGQRLGAYLLDGLILGVPIAILFFALVAALPRGDLEPCTDFDGNPALCEPLTGGSVAILLLVGLAAIVFVFWFWWGKLVGEKGQTPGRKAVNIKVVGRMTGEPVGMGKAIGRGLMSYVSGIPCYLGYLWMLWDGNNQTWHDKVVDSVVIVDR